MPVCQQRLIAFTYYRLDISVIFRSKDEKMKNKENKNVHSITWTWYEFPPL